jgi:hypothetical protein
LAVILSCKQHLIDQKTADGHAAVLQLLTKAAGFRHAQLLRDHHQPSRSALRSGQAGFAPLQFPLQLG